MTEQTNVIWTTTTKDGVRIQLTKNELTIDMAPDWVQTIDQRGRKVAEWFVNALLPHKIEIKDIRKVERDSRKIVIVSKKGFLKRCGIGLPKSELDQLETELNELVQ
jgi:hypothetical protein